MHEPAAPHNISQKEDGNFIGRVKKLFDMTDDSLNGLRTAISAIKEAFIFTIVGIVSILLHGIELRDTRKEIEEEDGRWLSYLVNRWKALLSIIGLGFAIILDRDAKQDPAKSSEEKAA
jgi:hypothetical protein